jgi:hypothetical protein
METKMTRKQRSDTIILDKNQLQNDYNELKSVRKVGKKYGISRETVRKYIHLYNLNYIKPIKYNCNENFFNEETESAYYFAGFLAADGCLFKKKGESYEVKLTLKDTDKDILFKFKQSINSDAPVIETKRLCRVFTRYFNITTAQFRIASKIVFNNLKQKFQLTPRKSLTLKFPIKLKNNELIRHFIRGYFDGDGSIYINHTDKKSGIKHMRISIVGTKHMLENIRYVLMRECIIKKGTIIKINNIYELRYGGNNIVYAIYKYLYKDATLFLERKKLKFEYISPR